MQHAANAYAKVLQTGQEPREFEAILLMKAAERINAIRANWADRQGELDAALTYNRKLWTVLATSATSKDNPLPGEIKDNIGRLAIFIFRHTLDLSTTPDPDRLAVLVEINRNIAMGLRAGAGA
jgi:flagellar protein FlaF